MKLSLFFLFIYRILVPVLLVLPYYMVNKDEYIYIIKLFIVAKVQSARSTMAQVTQQCQDMTLLPSLPLLPYDIDCHLLKKWYTGLGEKCTPDLNMFCEVPVLSIRATTDGQRDANLVTLNSDLSSL